MQFSDFKKHIEQSIISSNITRDFELTEITVDSRDVKPGTAFFALSGTSTDGHEYIEKALLNGACCAVGERKLDFPNYIQVTSVKKVLSELAALFYGNPEQKMDFIGVTGTNGKTTTTYMIEHILSGFIHTGVIGTVEYRWAGKTKKAPNTTPFIWSWYKLLHDMERDGTKIVVSEVSSHALEQKRIEGTVFNCALFTNFSRDHLDYHLTEENYFAAKKLLFTKHLRSDGKAIINIDDSKGLELLEEIKESVKTISFSLKNKLADLYCSSVEHLPFGLKLTLNYKTETWETTLPMVGIFNIYNMMGALLAVSDYIHPKKGCHILEKGISVPGRMEKVGDFARIFVDYAHSPDALLNILETANAIRHGGKIITLFGAGGDRDSGKRPLMGAIAQKYSDKVIITNDNPRKENPENIINDIISGVEDKSKITVINDRSLAIKEAISSISDKDILIIAGKGHEDYQILNSGTIYFSDRDEVLKAISSRD